MYDVRELTPEARRLGEICAARGEKVRQAVSLLSNMDEAKTVMQACEDIDRLESETDYLMRVAMRSCSGTSRTCAG